VILSLKEEIVSSGQMVALTSMAFGKAIVFSRVPAISQYFIEGVNGLGFEKGNPADLVQKLQELMSNPEMIEMLGRNARQTYERSFGMNRLISYIGNILNGRQCAKNKPAQSLRRDEPE
jgi:glycosyltransferase involved in cell wall biosynthesis